MIVHLAIIFSLLLVIAGCGATCVVILLEWWDRPDPDHIDGSGW